MSTGVVAAVPAKEPIEGAATPSKAEQDQAVLAEVYADQQKERLKQQRTQGIIYSVLGICMFITA